MSTPLFAAASAERALELDQRIVGLVYGSRVGIFGEHLSADERLVLKAIRYRRGSANTITIRELREKTELSDRAVKDAVRVLRLNFRIPIGASRDSERGGYFLIATAEDQALFLQGALRQIQAELEVIRAVGGQEQAAELLGQLRLALEGEEKKA
jgi:hypothetical protein